MPAGTEVKTEVRTYQTKSGSKTAQQIFEVKDSLSREDFLDLCRNAEGFIEEAWDHHNQAITPSLWEEVTTRNRAFFLHICKNPAPLKQWSLQALDSFISKTRDFLFEGELSKRLHLDSHKEIPELSLLLQSDVFKGKDAPQVDLLPILKWLTSQQLKAVVESAKTSQSAWLLFQCAEIYRRTEEDTEASNLWEIILKLDLPSYYFLHLNLAAYYLARVDFGQDLSVPLTHFQNYLSKATTTCNHYNKLVRLDEKNLVPARITAAFSSIQVDSELTAPHQIADVLLKSPVFRLLVITSNMRLKEDPSMAVQIFREGPAKNHVEHARLIQRVLHELPPSVYSLEHGEGKDHPLANIYFTDEKSPGKQLKAIVDSAPSEDAYSLYLQNPQFGIALWRAYNTQLTQIQWQRFCRNIHTLPAAIATYTKPFRDWPLQEILDISERDSVFFGNLFLSGILREKNVATEALNKLLGLYSKVPKIDVELLRGMQQEVERACRDETFGTYFCEVHCNYPGNLYPSDIVNLTKVAAQWKNACLLLLNSPINILKLFNGAQLATLCEQHPEFLSGLLQKNDWSWFVRRLFQHYTKSSTLKSTSTLETKEAKTPTEAKSDSKDVKDVKAGAVQDQKAPDQKETKPASESPYYEIITLATHYLNAFHQQLQTKKAEQRSEILRTTTFFSGNKNTVKDSNLEELALACAQFVLNRGTQDDLRALIELGKKLGMYRYLFQCSLSAKNRGFSKLAFDAWKAILASTDPKILQKYAFLNREVAHAYEKGESVPRDTKQAAHYFESYLLTAETFFDEKANREHGTFEFLKLPKEFTAAQYELFDLKSSRTLSGCRKPTPTLNTSLYLMHVVSKTASTDLAAICRSAIWQYYFANYAGFSDWSEAQNNMGTLPNFQEAPKKGEPQKIKKAGQEEVKGGDQKEMKKPEQKEAEKAVPKETQKPEQKVAVGFDPNERGYFLQPILDAKFQEIWQAPVLMSPMEFALCHGSNVGISLLQSYGANLASVTNIYDILSLHLKRVLYQAQEELKAFEAKAPQEAKIQDDVKDSKKNAKAGAPEQKNTLSSSLRFKLSSTLTTLEHFKDMPALYEPLVKGEAFELLTLMVQIDDEKSVTQLLTHLKNCPAPYMLMHARDNKGQTPLDYARSSEVTKHLKDHAERKPKAASFTDLFLYVHRPENAKHRERWGTIHTQLTKVTSEQKDALKDLRHLITTALQELTPRKTVVSSLLSIISSKPPEFPDAMLAEILQSLLADMPPATAETLQYTASLTAYRQKIDMHLRHYETFLKHQQHKPQEAAQRKQEDTTEAKAAANSETKDSKNMKGAASVNADTDRALHTDSGENDFIEGDSLQSWVNLILNTEASSGGYRQPNILGLLDAVKKLPQFGETETKEIQRLHAGTLVTNLLISLKFPHQLQALNQTEALKNFSILNDLLPPKATTSTQKFVALLDSSYQAQAKSQSRRSHQGFIQQLTQLQKDYPGKLAGSPKDAKSEADKTAPTQTKVDVTKATVQKTA